MNPVSTFPPSFFKIYLNIILPSIPRSFRWSLYLQVFWPKFSLHFSRHLLMPHVSHHPWFDHPNITGSRVRIMTLFSVQFSPAFCHFLLDLNILWSILFLDTLNLYSSLNVTEQISPAYRIRGKIVVLCILIFMFLHKAYGRKSILDWMMVSSPRHSSALNLFVNAISISYHHS